MKRATPTKPKPASGGNSGKPIVSSQGSAGDSAVYSSRGHHPAGTGSTSMSPGARRRGQSTGSSTDSPAAVKKQRDFSQLRSPHGTATAATPTKAVAPRKSTTQASPPKLQSSSPRKQLPGSARQIPTGHGSSSSRRRSAPVPALVSSTAAAHAASPSAGSATVAEGSPRYNAMAAPRRVTQRAVGTLSPARGEPSLSDPAPLSDGAAAPVLHMSGDVASVQVPARSREPAAVVAEPHSASPTRPVFSTPHAGPTAKDGAPTAEVGGTAAPARVKMPPQLTTLLPHKDADDIDALDLGLAPRLGDLPSAATGDRNLYPAEDMAPLDVPGTPPSHCTRRKSSVWSSEQTNRSLLLNGSGATLPPPADSASRRHTWMGGGDDADALGGTGLSAAEDGSSPALGASPSKTVSTTSSSPIKLVSTHLAAPAATAKENSPPAHQLRKKSAEKGDASRQASKSPSVKASAGKASVSSAVTPTSSPSPLKKKTHVGTSGGSGRVNGALASPIASHVTSAHLPTKAAATTGVATTTVSGGRPSTPVKMPFKAKSSLPMASTGAKGSPKQRSVTPSGLAATAINTNPTTTVANDSSTAPKANPHPSTLYNQRAAAMLSQMLSVVRPMAPVVHVRIRPVLPSIGESNHQRHVYLLDHENVMITGTRSGFSAGATSASAVNTMLSSTTDYAAAKRVGAADARGGGAARRSQGGILSAASSAVLANSTSSGWHDAKSSFPTGSAAAVAAAVGGGSGLTLPTPATLYGGNSTLLLAAPENPSSLHDLGNTTTSAGTNGHHAGASPNAAPGSPTLELLSSPGATPALGALNHPRTTSWLSQGSEEVAVGSRLSGGSHSTSPPQLGLPPSGASASLNSAVSTPHTRPRLAAFTAFAEDALVSPTTTPRGLAASGAVVGGKAVEKRRESGRRTSALTQQSASLSAVTAPGLRKATRKTSIVSGGSAVSPQKASRAASGIRRPTPRSGLGASVSVSAMSMPTLSRGDITKSPAAEDGRLSRSPVHDLLTGSTTFAEASIGAGVASPSNSPGANGTEQHYSFEFVHDEEATQADVFEESVLRFADEALLAQNVAIICYGPTGSGKTYSMMGSQAQPVAPGTTGSGAAAGAAATAGSGGGGASKLPGKTPNAQSCSATRSGGRLATGRSGVAKGGIPLGRRPIDCSRPTSTSEGKRRHADDTSATAAGGDEDGADHQDRSVGMIDDDESEGNTWPQLGSSWQYGYTDRFTKRALAGGGDEGGADRHAESEGGDGSDGYPHSGHPGAAGSVMTSASMAEMGILPRLVHTLLERRGEAITIRRESGRDAAVTPAGGSTPGSPQPTTRPTSASKTTSLSLTLRDLTFYGIELYMDELCDLLDPGKRPIQTVSDTGGLAALCQRINEARDYRINGRRGGASQVCVASSSRTGGGMPITSLADLRRAYRLAHGNRVTSKHAQNDTSSRSHAIFLLQLDFDLVESRVETQQQQRRHDGGTDGVEAPVETVQRVHSYVAMVDLAGCERVKQTKVEGAALREAQYINKSLSALSSVVLSLHRNNAHVPYRDSKLTRLLRPCLEGGRVLTLVHVSPCSSTETINALKFADQIRHTHIPTHALTPTSSKHRELLDVFADLIDPMQGFWEAQVRHAQSQLHRLCADIRLAYFSRAVGEVTRHSATGHTLSAGSGESDAVSEVSALTDVDDSISLSPGDMSLEEGPPPLTEDVTEKEKRSFALHSLLHQLMGPIHQHQRISMRDAIRAIRRRKEHKIASHERQLQQRIEKLQSAVEKLTATNEKLASENRTPLPRDPYALELNRQLRETAEQISETTKEQAALSTLTVALRQRLANQDMLESTVDEQLRKVQHRTAQALQTLSAAAAAHPHGLVPPPASSPSAPGVALPAPSSPREPTLPTGSPVPAVIAMKTDDDPELRDIAHQQISLAKELAALRLETACFEIGTGMWEGLWARAMRKEIVTALEVEVFAMERILLDRRALSLMLMDDDADGAVTAGEAEEGDAVNTADTLKEHASAPSKTNLSADDAQLTTTPPSSVSTVARPQNASKSRGSLAAAMRSALWARLGIYLHSREPPRDAIAEAPFNDPDKATAAAPTLLDVHTHARTDGQPGSLRTPPPPPPPTSSSSSLSAWRHDCTNVAQTANSETSEPRSSEGQQHMRGVGSSGSASYMRPVSPSSRTAQRLTEELTPNPLTVLAMAHDDVVRQQQQQQQLQRPVEQQLEGNVLAVCTPPPSPRRTDAARPSSAAIAAALLPLTISGTYGDEQVMQEACLQLLLRDGIPCEACCMGNSASHVLQHYVLPGSADAPLAEEMDDTEKAAGGTGATLRSVTNTSTTGAVHYAVKTPPTTPRDAAASGEAAMACGATGASKRQGPGSVADTHVAFLPSSPVPAIRNLHARPAGSGKNASCTTRLGRLRLVRMPRRPNCYVLEFVYTHQGLPMPPRLRAALTGKPEESFTPTPRRTNLEQMVDALPSVHGVAGRGGARAPGAVSLKEHRLFAIPLHEPSLHLHLHVLEEGIPEMTTPVAATWASVSPAPSDAVEASANDSNAAAAASPLCVARRVEYGPQIVLEVQGVPFTASARRTLPVVAATQASTTPLSASKKKHKVATGKTPKKTVTHGSNSDDVQMSPAKNKTPKSASACAGPEVVSSASSASTGWSDLVLAKRLSGGGELMLPSSCILANKGCCSLLLRFPQPFFSPMTRTESVEAIVGALCGILRPVLTVPEVRLSARSTRSSSKKSVTNRRRRSASPGTTTSAGVAEKPSGGTGSGGHRRCRGSVSRFSMPGDGERAVELDVITYAHVPYTMFAAEPPAAEKAEEAATASAERSASSSVYALPSPSAPAAAAGRVARTPSSSVYSTSMARSDSLDGLVGSCGGVLGHTVQSSCSPGHRSRVKPHAGTSAGLHLNPTLSTSPVRTPSGSTATAATPTADQQSGATLQVQFHWVPTPLDVEPPRGAGAADGGTQQRLRNQDEKMGADQGASERLPLALPCGPDAPSAGHHALLRPTADDNLRRQIRSALGILTHLSYISVEGRPSLPVSGTTESALSELSLHGGDKSCAVLAQEQDLTKHCMPSSGAGVKQYTDAACVAALLRQLDTYRQRIRRLFRQQLYDAEDVLGDDVQLGGLNRGAYMRDIQTEVKQMIGLPGTTHTHHTDGGASSLTGSPSRVNGADDSRGGGSAMAHSLFSLESGEGGPNTRVTIPEAREVCGAAVPWTVWQWAYRWSQLRRLLLVPEPHLQRAAAAAAVNGSGVATTDAAATWLPMDACASETSLAVGRMSHLVSTPTSVPVTVSAGYMSSSSSSSEGYVMEGDWLSEAKYAARSKRVWLPDVLSTAIPSYLESCAADYSP
jgi:hypothetical protein